MIGAYMVWLVSSLILFVVFGDALTALILSLFVLVPVVRWATR